MKLSSASLYAIRALTSMAGQDGTSSVPSHVTARASGTPERFLLKVLKPLVSARILHSVKGPHGGYRLARPANQITLLDIMEAVDGAVRGHGPGDTYDERPLDEQLQVICDKSAEQLRQQLKKVKLSELVGKMAGGAAK
jgi:Rrf2 family protein